MANEHPVGQSPPKTPPGVAHVAIQGQVDGENVDWMEPVTDEQSAQ